ncbi:MAG: AAA family ATPase, partial [Oscillospiraceae bacterium]|nr:AAA family ATPase [Oscillospiraceae bacterium]
GSSVPDMLYEAEPKVIDVPVPDLSVLRCFIEAFFPNAADTDKSAKVTAGMRLSELNDLRRLISKDGVESIDDAISIYRFGYKDDPWKHLRQLLRKTDIEAALSKRVRGQEDAVRNMANSLTTALEGMSGLVHSSVNTMPKGCIMLVGPSGTGKTELSKAVTELCMGDESKMIRIDCSEYEEKQSMYRLFGSPPGYVGYSEGGQLTEAVKSQKSYVILFDEFEKAHTAIQEALLQILEDGRLTDGRGETVFFSQCLIIFTSNAGMTRDVTDPSTGRVIGSEYAVDPDDTEEHIRDMIISNLKLRFRPEFINRIGEENIIIYRFMDEVATRSIVDMKLETFIENNRSVNGYQLIADSSVNEMFYDLAASKEQRKYGGRGINNLIRYYLGNPLSVFTKKSDAQDGDTIYATCEHGELSFSLS